MRRIEICGGIASGKTTLALLFEKSAFLPVYEDFKSNPFWEIFYKNPPNYAFETEVTFSLQHYQQIKTAFDDGGRVIVSDFSTVLDRAYAHVSLESDQLQTYLAVHSQIMSEIGAPDLLVHLRRGADELLQRVRNRNRPEEAAMRVEFLESLNESLHNRVEEARASGQKTLIIDSEVRKFAYDIDEAQRTIKEVLEALA